MQGFNNRRLINPFNNPFSRRGGGRFDAEFGAIKVPKKKNPPKIKVKPKKAAPVKKPVVKKVVKVAPKKVAPVKKVVKVAPKPKVAKPVNKTVKNAPKKVLTVKKVTNKNQIPKNSNGVLVQKSVFDESPVVVQTKGSGIGDKLLGLASQVIAGIMPRDTIQTADGQIPLYPVGQNQTQYETDYSDNLSVRPSRVNSDGSASGNIESTANSVGSGIGGLFEWGRENLGIVAVVVGGLFLLMKSPPQYGNRR